MRYMPPGDPVKRIRWFSALLLIALAAFVFKLADYQLIEAGAINKVSKDNRSKTRTLPAERGEILDANGVVLARSVTKYDINAAPINVAPIERVINGQKVTITVEQQAAEIATILGMTQADVLTKISGKSQYSNIKKSVGAAEYSALQKLNLPWLYYDPKESRIYPNGAVAGNLMGFIGQDGTPLAGLELEYNSCLAGVDGQETYDRGTDGIRIPSSAVVRQAPRNGSNLRLTINSDLQYYAQQVVANTTRNLNADWGTGIVIEVKTGKLLAAAEAPTVDGNAFWKYASKDLGSRIFQATFEPGSTVKTLTASALIDTGKATPETRVLAPYSLRMPWGQTITDSHLHGTEKLTLAGVLRDSSNTGIVQLGSKLDAQSRWDYLKAYGFGQSTSVKFEGEASGSIRNWKQWDLLTDKVSMFGQGIAVTPLQMAMVYQTIANKGERLQPRLVDGCVAKNGSVVAPPSSAGVQVIKPSSAQSTIDMLEKVVEQGGIGRTAGIPGYRIAGKSGTAQIQQGRGYGYLHAISFIGMAPAENPQYVVAVTFYKSRNVSTSLGATPAFKQIMAQVLRMYRVPPSTGKSANIPTTW